MRKLEYLHEVRTSTKGVFQKLGGQKTTYEIVPMFHPLHLCTNQINMGRLPLPTREDILGEMPNGQYLFHARCISSVLAEVLRHRNDVCAWVHSGPPLGDAATFNYHLGHVQHAQLITAECITFSMLPGERRLNAIVFWFGEAVLAVLEDINSINQIQYTR